MTGSQPAVLVLHGVRLLGFATTEAVAARFGLEESWTGEQLEDHRADGLVSWSSFGGSAGWSLTTRGRVEGEALLASELEATGRRHLVHRTYLEFLDLNARVLQAVTDWQTRPVAGDPFAANALAPLAGTLSSVLDRMSGYSERYEAALARARGGEREWVDGLGRDSCHTVWFQLHEALLATLGVPRGHGPC